jgi:hypothetical protein
MQRIVADMTFSAVALVGRTVDRLTAFAVQSPDRFSLPAAPAATRRTPRL